MRRTTSLITATLTALALLGPAGGTAPAAAAGETCRGEAATIVGSGGTRITGTEGRDVVVTNRSQFVDTLGGDDLVCVTGPDLAPGHYRPVEVHTGPGADVVDGTATPSWPANGTLGTGADRLEGGSGAESIDAGPSPREPDEAVDNEHDVLLGGGNRDSLSSGEAGLVNTDVVHGGADDDSLGIAGTVSDAAAIDGGEGSDYTVLQLAGGENTVSNAFPGGTGELRHGAAAVVRWTSIERFYLRDPATGTASVTINGGPADESFSHSGKPRTIADLGAGDDNLSALTALSADSTVAAGAGSDRLAMGSEEHAFTWDLAGDVFRVGDAWTLSVTGFEHAFLAAPGIDVSGTDEDNRLSFVTCDLTVRGLGGDDSMWLGADHEWEQYRSCPGDTVMKGGPGDDRFETYGKGSDLLAGGGGKDAFDAKGGRDVVLGGGGRDVGDTGPGADRFIGGPGRDRVDGHRGRDRCVAEREVRCER